MISKALLAGAATPEEFAISVKDMNQLIRRAFGQTLACIDLDDDPVANRETLLTDVSGFLLDAPIKSTFGRSFVFGCWLIRDSRRRAVRPGEDRTPASVADPHAG